MYQEVCDVFQTIFSDSSDFSRAGVVERDFSLIRVSLVRAGPREIAFGHPLTRLLLERGHAKPTSEIQRTHFD